MLEKALPDVHESIDKGIGDVVRSLNNSRNTAINLLKTINWNQPTWLQVNCFLINRPGKHLPGFYVRDWVQLLVVRAIISYQICMLPAYQVIGTGYQINSASFPASTFLAKSRLAGRTM